MNKITKSLKNLEVVLDDIDNKNSSFNLYNHNLNYLLASKSKADFLKRYKIQLDSGLNTIELDSVDLDTLEDLKCSAIDTVKDYADVYFEELCDEEYD